MQQVSDDVVGEKVNPVDSQSPDDVVHVETHKTWIDVVCASFKASDHHVSDDEIFAILNAPTDGESAADLCTAKGVTLPMYCVWKSKYRHLNIDELRRARRQELWRARALLTVLLTVAVSAIGGLGAVVFDLGSAAQASITRAAEPAPPVAAPVRTGAATPIERNDASVSQAESAPAPAPPGEVPIATPPPAAPTASRVPPQELTVEEEARAAAVALTTDPIYNVQVAAAPSLQDARTLVEQLAAAGHRAYLSRAIVGNVEVFRVRVGPFEALPAAEQVAGQLRREGHNGAWIAR